MKKAISVLVLAIFLAALLPSVTAQEIEIPETPAGAETPVTAPPKVTSVRKPVIQRLTELRERIVTGAKALTASKIAKLKTSQLREYQKEKLQIALERCRAKNLSGCEEKIQARLALVDRLKNRSLQLLNTIEQKKVQVINALQEVKKIAGLAKYRILRARDYVARIVSNVDLNRAREKYLFARTKLIQARDRYELAKAGFNRIKAQLQACEANESAECEQLRAEIKLKAKDFLNHTLEMVLNQLEKVKAKVQESQSLTDEEASSALEKIDAKIASVQELQELVAGITENTTKEEIQDIVAQIRQVWKEEFKPVLERWAGFIQTARMGGIYVRLKHLEKKLNSVLARMVEKGKDVAEVQELVDQFGAKIEEAKQNYLTSQEKFREAANLTGEARNAAIREAQEAMRSAHRSLKEAHRLLKDIVSALRAQKAVQELEEDETEEVVEEQEEALVGAEKIEVVVEAGAASIKISVNDTEQTFTIESENLDEIAQETAARTGLELEKVQELMEVEVKE